jgi:hypothetical protein
MVIPRASIRALKASELIASVERLVEQSDDLRRQFRRARQADEAAVIEIGVAQFL